MNPFLLRLLLIPLLIPTSISFAVWSKPDAPLSDGPFPHEHVTNTFELSRDFGFDGKGNVIGHFGTTGTMLVHSSLILEGKTGAIGLEGVKTLIAPPDKATVWIPDCSLSLHGQRFRANGDYIVAHPKAKPRKNIMGILSKHVAFKALDKKERKSIPKELGGYGNIAPFLMPRFIHTDLAGNIWYTGGQSKSVTAGAPEPTINLVGPLPENKYTNIAKGAPLQNPNGIVYDSHRKIIFYTEEKSQKLMRIAYTPGETPGSIEEVTTFPEGPSRQVALDQYGNLYACSGEYVYRVRLDDSGAAQGDPIPLNKDPIPRLSSLNFGHGEGWEKNSLYTISEPEVWKVVAGTVFGTKPEYTSPIHKINLGVAGDPDAQMNPANFRPETQELYQKYVDQKLAEYPAYLEQAKIDIEKRTWVKENPVQESPPFLELQKIGATAKAGINHGITITFDGSNLTGNEPELAQLEAYAQDIAKRRESHIGVMGQHPGNSWGYGISFRNNPDLKNFDFLKHIPNTAWEVRADNCPHFTDKELTTLQSIKRISWLTLANTSITIDGIANFLTKTKPGYLHLTCVTDQNIDKIITAMNSGRRTPEWELTFTNDQLTIAGLQKLKALSTLNSLSIDPSISKADINKLKKALPNAKIRTFKPKK